MNDAEPPGRLVRFLFRVYKTILSPMLHAISPAQCKFLPTCSEYAYVAVSRHGLWRGQALAFHRLARCHPFAEGGFDPVPARTNRVKEASAEPRASKCRHLS